MTDPVSSVDNSPCAADLIHEDDQKTRKSYKNQFNSRSALLIESDDEEEDDMLNLSAHQHSLEAIPSALCETKGPLISTLILTNNRLRSLKALRHFPNLETLQLDRNALTNIADLPKLPKLKTLWLNNNRLKDLHALALVLERQCPQLEFLSLLMNPLCA